MRPDSIITNVRAGIQFEREYQSFYRRALISQRCTLPPGQGPAGTAPSVRPVPMQRPLASQHSQGWHSVWKDGDKTRHFLCSHPLFLLQKFKAVQCWEPRPAYMLEGVGNGDRKQGHRKGNRQYLKNSSNVDEVFCFLWWILIWEIGGITRKKWQMSQSHLPRSIPFNGPENILIASRYFSYKRKSEQLWLCRCRTQQHIKYVRGHDRY